MRQAFCLILVCFSVLLVGSLPGAACGTNCVQIQWVNFTCEIPNVCPQTVLVKDCQQGTVAAKDCLECPSTVNCCGQPICNAAQAGACVTSPTIVLKEATKWDLALLDTLYVPGCQGGLIRLSRIASVPREVTH